MGGRERELFSRGVRACSLLSPLFLSSFSSLRSSSSPTLIDSSRARSKILVKVLLPPPPSSSPALDLLIFLSRSVGYTRNGEKRVVRERKSEQQRGRGSEEERHSAGPFDLVRSRRRKNRRKGITRKGADVPSAPSRPRSRTAMNRDARVTFDESVSHPK